MSYLRLSSKKIKIEQKKKQKKNKTYSSHKKKKFKYILKYSMENRLDIQSYLKMCSYMKNTFFFSMRFMMNTFVNILYSCRVAIVSNCIG